MQALQMSVVPILLSTTMSGMTKHSQDTSLYSVLMTLYAGGSKKQIEARIERAIERNVLTSTQIEYPDFRPSETMDSLLRSVCWIKHPSARKRTSLSTLRKICKKLDMLHTT